MKKNLYFFAFFLFLIFLLPNVICQAANGYSNTLEIITPQNMNECEEFNITILSNGTPVPDVIVMIKNSASKYFSVKNIKETNDNGIIAYTPPEIYSESKSYLTIIAAKVGYITNETIVHIIDLPNLRTTDTPVLYGNEIYNAIVKDDSGNLINNAEVSIWDKNFTTMYVKNYTDENGEVTLRAPSEPGTYFYKSVKTGYASGESIFFVFTPDPLINIDFNVLFFYLFLFTIFVIIPVVIFYVIFRNKSKKKK